MSQLMSQIRRGAGEAGAVVRSMDFPSLLENHRGEIERALPKHLPVDRIMRIALTAFRKVPTLAECDPVSVLAAVIQASQLGLEVQQNGEAFLVPFDKCRIPDDCIDSRRYPLFMARAVLKELIESLQSTRGVKPC